MEKPDEIDEAQASGITRRRALKAAAAVGVGAAVWGGPQIGRIGSTPAYAHACTTDNERFVLDDRNTDCSCQGTVAYHKFNTPSGVITFADGSAIVTEGPLFNTTGDPICGDPVTNKKCPDGTDTPGVCITLTAATNCKATVEGYQSSAPEIAIFTGSGGIVSGPGKGYSVLPALPVSGNLCNTRIRVLLECNTHIHCLQ